MRRTIGSIAVAALLLLGSSPGAIAFHDDATPLLHAGATNGPGWVVYTFTTNGAKVIADIMITAYNDGTVPAQLGEVLYADDGTPVVTFGITSTSTNGAYVHSDAVPGYPVHADVLSPASAQNLGAGLRLNDGVGASVTGRYRLLLWASGGIRKASFSLRGDPGTSFVRLKTGSDAFLHMSKDFEGAATIAAGAGNTQANASARANVATAVVESIEHTFVGFFYTPALTGVDRLTMNGPAGPRNCSCWFWDTAADRGAAGPGTYTFEVTGAGAGGVLGEVILGGVDVAMPEEADLGILRLEAFGPPQLAVGQAAAVTLQEVITNAAGFAPMDAGLTTTAAASSGASVDPGESSSTHAGLGKGEVRQAEETFTVTCLEAGPKAITFDSVIRPTDPGDADPNPTNDAGQTTLTVECVA